MLLTDADRLFRAREFIEFTTEWVTSHIMSSPHYHQSNGKAESAVAIVKKIMKRSQAADQDWRRGILAYNDTPQRKLGGATPGEMFFSRKMRTGPPMGKHSLRPSTKHHQFARSAKIAAAEKMKKAYDRGAEEIPTLQIGDIVRILPTKLGVSKWTQGEVTRKLPTRSFQIKTAEGKVIRDRRHLFQTERKEKNETLRDIKQCQRIQDGSGFRVPAWLWELGPETEKKMNQEITTGSTEEEDNAEDSEFADAREELMRGERHRETLDDN